jgi:cytochrome oxidase Cu insertion factor (SCO1/SenC/PrrC family)
MNKKYAAVFALAAALVTGSLFMAQAQTQVKPPPSDSRIDKLLEQSDQILKNQDQIMKDLSDLKEGVLQLRRRSS